MVANQMKKCPYCLEQIPANAGRCDICNTDLSRPHQPPGGERKAQGSNTALKVVGGVVALLGFLFLVIFVLSRRNFSEARKMARKKSCYANMRVLLGGVEMFNMDQKTEKTYMRTLDIRKLQQAGYIKSIPVCPEPGNHYEGENLHKDGVITCEGGSLSHGRVN